MKCLRPCAMLRGHGAIPKLRDCHENPLLVYQKLIQNKILVLAFAIEETNTSMHHPPQPLQLRLSILFHFPKILLTLFPKAKERWMVASNFGKHPVTAIQRDAAVLKQGMLLGYKLSLPGICCIYLFQIG
jgi:hypothetical protein